MLYEFNGEKYKQVSAHQKEWGHRLITELGLQGAESILDLGCGDGVLTRRLADLAPRGRVVGIDFSHQMIAAARKHHADNLTFLIQDITRMDFRDEFDIVVSNAALHWIHNHDVVLENVYRSLRPDGLLRFSFGGDGNCVHLLRVLHEAVALPEYQRHFAAFEWPWYMPGVAGYEALLQTKPFRKSRVWMDNADRFFPNEAALIGWIDQPSLVPFLAHVDEDDRQRFRDFVVARMIEETRQPDGTCFETFRRLNVLAQK